MAPFICPDCAKVYKRFEDLQNHLKETCRHLEETVRLANNFSFYHILVLPVKIN